MFFKKKSVIIPTIIEIFHIFELTFSKSSAAYSLYVGKVLNSEHICYNQSHYPTVCMHVKLFNSFSAKGNIELFANNADSGESARNELSHLKSALFGREL